MCLFLIIGKKNNTGRLISFAPQDYQSAEWDEMILSCSLTPSIIKTF
jgi:hypothetical protein